MPNHTNASSAPTIGILGGGQLARMTAMAAFDLGMNVHIYDANADSPAGQIAQRHTLAEIADTDALIAFADSCDVVTLESEFIDEVHLHKIERAGHALFPRADSVQLIQDKFVQKQTFRNAGIPVADFEKCDSVADAITFGDAHGYPFLLKRRRGSYDGYGNATVDSKADVASAFASLASSPDDAAGELYCEAFVPFVREIAIMIARRPNGELAVYPVVETIQRNHICHLVIAPTELDDASANEVRRQATLAVESIDGVGVFGIELFLQSDGSVLLNEIAPRPHNSGHYTIEGCVTSQFENHIRAILDLPLGDTSLVAPAAVMINVLGRSDAESGAVANYDELMQIKGIHVHMYAKSRSRKGRKMGHITVLAQTTQAAIETATSAEGALRFIP